MKEPRTILAETITKACSALSLKCVSPHSIKLSDGNLYLFEALIPDLGGAKGMLITKCASDVYEVGNELVKLGYGYSVLEDPDESELFDLNEFIEIFSDWGWGNAQTEEPNWMKNPS